MCANYRPSRARAIDAAFGVSLADDYPEEVWPGTRAPIVVRRERGDLAAPVATFGLLPTWAISRALARRTYNARVETVHTLPSFRSAWRSGQFCVVPIARFFEPNWESGKPVRWAIEPCEGAALGAAGLWSEWIDRASGDVVMSYSLITRNCADDPLLARFHGVEDEKRTLHLLDRDAQHAWLDVAPADAKAFLAAARPIALRAEPAPLARRAAMPASGTLF